MDRESAEKAIRNGAIAGFSLAGLGTLIVVFALTMRAEGDLAYFADFWHFFDIGIMVALAFGVLYRSRVAAVFLLVDFILGNVLRVLETGKAFSHLPALIFIYFYMKAIQGTFVYHRLRREEDPAYRAGQFCFWSAAIPVLLIFYGMVGFGTVINSGATVPTGVVGANGVRPTDMGFLRSRGILEPGEEIVLFYSSGFLSIEGNGNLLTDSRAISYETWDKELYCPPLRTSRR